MPVTLWRARSAESSKIHDSMADTVEYQSDAANCSRRLRRLG
jgi:hypothetical protein